MQAGSQLGRVGLSGVKAEGVGVWLRSALRSRNVLILEALGRWHHRTLRHIRQPQSYSSASPPGAAGEANSAFVGE